MANVTDELHFLLQFSLSNLSLSSHGCLAAAIFDSVGVLILRKN